VEVAIGAGVSFGVLEIHEEIESTKTNVLNKKILRNLISMTSFYLFCLYPQLFVIGQNSHPTAGVSRKWAERDKA